MPFKFRKEVKRVIAELDTCNIDSQDALTAIRRLLKVPKTKKRKLHPVLKTLAKLPIDFDTFDVVVFGSLDQNKANHIAFLSSPDPDKMRHHASTMQTISSEMLTAATLTEAQS